MEEFERLEIDLKSLFDQYIVRVRCLDALRSQLAARVKSPNQHQFTIAASQTGGDTSISFLPDGLMIDSDDEEALHDNDDDDEELRIPGERRRGGQQRSNDERTAMVEAGQLIRESRRVATGNRLRVRTAANRGGGGGGAASNGRFVGNMMGGSSDMDSSLDTDDDSEVTEDESEMIGLGLNKHMDDDDDVNDVDKLGLGAGEKLARKPKVFSDEDF